MDTILHFGYFQYAARALRPPGALQLLPQAPDGQCGSKNTDTRIEQIGSAIPLTAVVAPVSLRAALCASNRRRFNRSLLGRHGIMFAKRIVGHGCSLPETDAVCRKEEWNL